MVHTKFAIRFYKKRKHLCHRDSTELQICLKQQNPAIQCVTTTLLFLYDHDNNLHNVIYLYMQICDISR